MRDRKWRPSRSQINTRNRAEDVAVKRNFSILPWSSHGRDRHLPVRGYRHGDLRIPQKAHCYSQRKETRLPRRRCKTRKLRHRCLWWLFWRTRRKHGLPIKPPSNTTTKSRHSPPPSNLHRHNGRLSPNNQRRRSSWPFQRSYTKSAEGSSSSFDNMGRIRELQEAYGP